MVAIKALGKTGALLAAILFGPQLANSHSWVERLNRIASNGTMVEPAGFAAGFSGRGAGFSDIAVTNEVSGAGLPLCKQPVTAPQDPSFPVLTAAPGDQIAIRYLENGHVTNLEPGRLDHGGVVYIYGTTDPRPDDTLADIHLKWTPDGKGGDGRGKLLATRKYDDGRCYEANGFDRSDRRQDEFPVQTNELTGPNNWCQSDVSLAKDLPQGTQYTLYWVWNWPGLDTEEKEVVVSDIHAVYPKGGAPAGRKDLEGDHVKVAQIYSSCAMINIEGETIFQQAGNDSNSSAPFASSGLGQGVRVKDDDFITNPTDYNGIAIADQLENPFIVAIDGIGSGPEQGVPTASPSAGTDIPTTTPVGGIRTVTVTAEPTTVYATATVTAGAGNAGGPPTVTPFMPRRNLRGRASWEFGANN
ncbi:hypothetical protein VD0004_g2046 [Verticillium dahliae]|uniref:DUF7492 domain-containing protein n=1 Tax=Verticillium dahliae TaxID=27337 RepID=A0A444S9T1_VERDA|nr:hypothetical protein VD0004_g2046 [Verticillium dahliae]PNH66564.1 hypothetical protein VD0001_g8113 [Verticillium dahliae]RXG50145.1 hypothetical protein VDGE_01003 [Verticillium dahliae]